MSNPIPHEDGMDHTLSLLREGYLYILNRRRGFNSDVFETRLLGKKAICMGGKDAAEIFYDPDKFQREGSAPNRLKQTLFGKGAIQTLDGAQHKHRKEMFMSLMSLDNLKRLKEMIKVQWETTAEKWEQSDEIVFYEEVQEMLCKVACQWAGVPVPGDEVKNLTNDLEAMYESPGAMGPDHWKGRNARNRVEKWVQELVDNVRDGKIQPPEETALFRFSWHRDLEGNLLNAEIVSVEVINILRPIVAISIYLNFTLLALHHHPEERKKLLSGDEKHAEMFIQEVRRYYPFFPFIAARVRTNFMWKNYQFEENTLTLLDLYGTNHDPLVWDNPDVFRPQRFNDWEGSPFGFIPQGGGEYLMGHRCAGEWVTMELMKESLDYLLNGIAYDVPNQDLSYSMVSVPSIPHSKIVIQNVNRN
ncbi:fatty-acid peroxygenase [Mesobacillus persicus]|uniref:Fatty-acid peroxygenase n=1 Tax=Mesobacillus persicus TaxID=930146 RepID=A0A1H8KUE6_9BACI|nr:cytochrome P450 [Mesobacillus persicus]SEN96507.1 fatty-acid peroxygenase [Mesobacillus persicus]